MEQQALDQEEQEALEAAIKAVPGIAELPAYGEVVRTSGSLASDMRRGWLAARDYHQAEIADLRAALNREWD